MVRDAVHDPSVEVEAVDLRELHAHVGLAPEDAAQGRGDLAGGEDAGPHLIEQRLEEMMVGAVDEGDVDREVAEGVRGAHAPEPTTDDHDPVSVSGGRLGHNVLLPL